MRRLLSLVLTLAVLVLSVGACDAGKKGSAVEGKVVDADNKPLSGIQVVATQNEPLKGYEKIEVKTKADGTFVLKGLYPQAGYRIAPVGNHFNKKATTINITSGPSGESKMITAPIVMRFSPFKVGANGIINDTRTGLEWLPCNGEERSWEMAKQYTESLSVDGGGWRLPTIGELQFLYNPYYEDFYKFDPVFNIKTGDLWSGTLSQNPRYALLLYSVNGTFQGWIIDMGYRFLSVRSPK